jgi:hypothetical protein
MSWNINFVMAIAFNLLLISGNIFLLCKIQEWRKLLYQSRQQFNLCERQLQSQTEMMVNNLNSLPLAAYGIVQQKQKLDAFISQGKILLSIVKMLRNLV